MKYTIFSINDSRKHYTDSLRTQLASWQEVETKSINGSDPQQLAAAQAIYRYPVKFAARLGHLGIWYTVLNSLNHAPVVTLEDDAMLGSDFIANFEDRLAELPSDADFFALFLPRDSDHLYSEELAVSPLLTKTYQRYGGVSMYYTKVGVEKIRVLLDHDGITDQYDNTLYHYAKTGELNGYTSKPSLSDLVYITGTEKSIVHETEYYEA